jgi:hypothetical protein
MLTPSGSRNNSAGLTAMSHLGTMNTLFSRRFYHRARPERANEIRHQRGLAVGSGNDVASRSEDDLHRNRGRQDRRGDFEEGRFYGDFFF